MDDAEVRAMIHRLLHAPVCLYYRLDGHTPVPMHDGVAWSVWFEQTERHVGHDYGEGWELSTVFLGRVLFPEPGKPPALFETMLFRTQGEARTLGRYATWEKAAEMHTCWRALLRMGLAEALAALEEPTDTGA